MYMRVCSLSVSLRPQLVMLGLVLCLGRFCVVSGQTNSTTLSQTFPLASDEGAIRERIATVIRETIKQGEGYIVDGYKFWTRVPPSTKDVEEIKSYGDKAVPILEEYLFSDVGREGNLVLRILGRMGGSRVVEPLKRVVEQSTCMAPGRRIEVVDAGALGFSFPHYPQRVGNGP
jgi:hypothetical protein